MTYREAVQYARVAKKYLIDSDILAEVKKSMIYSALAKPKPNVLDREGFKNRYPNQFKKVM